MSDAVRGGEGGRGGSGDGRRDCGDARAAARAEAGLRGGGGEEEAKARRIAGPDGGGRQAENSSGAKGHVVKFNRGGMNLLNDEPERNEPERQS